MKEKVKWLWQLKTFEQWLEGYDSSHWVHPEDDNRRDRQGYVLTDLRAAFGAGKKPFTNLRNFAAIFFANTAHIKDGGAAFETARAALKCELELLKGNTIHNKIQDALTAARKTPEYEAEGHELLSEPPPSGELGQDNFEWLRGCYDQLKASHDRLKEALKTAVVTIRAFDGMGMSPTDAKSSWECYQHSPEMKKINAALAGTDPQPSVDGTRAVPEEESL